MIKKVIPSETSFGETGRDQAAGSLARAMILLEVLTRAAPEGVLISDLISRSKLPRATVYRVLGMLCDAGWVEVRENKKYYFGMGLFSLSHAAQSHQSIDKVALPHLAKLSEQLGQAIYLTMRVGIDAVCLSRLKANDIVQMLVMDVGSRIPLGLGAGGLAMLAALPETERNDIVKINIPRYMRRSGFDAEVFRAALATTMQKGYASHRGLFTTGVAGIGVPVFDSQARPLVAISTAFLYNWIAPKDYSDVAALMSQTAEAIHTDLIGNKPATAQKTRKEKQNDT